MKTLEKPAQRPTVAKTLPTKRLNKNDYTSVWLAKELRQQIELIRTTRNVCTQIQLYQYMEYSKAQFDYRYNKNGDTPLTRDLLKKRNELLEARLVERGFESKAPPVFVIFLLKNNHGYTDERQQTNTNISFNVTRGISAPKRKVINNLTP